ncbi:MAG: hypothetical protein R3F17_06075 [Planctomycetota bacterium]
MQSTQSTYNSGKFQGPGPLRRTRFGSLGLALAASMLLASCRASSGTSGGDAQSLDATIHFDQFTPLVLVECPTTPSTQGPSGQPLAQGPILSAE